jgi:aminoglycoside phosphotransferase (APT) family kinase protein
MRDGAITAARLLRAAGWLALERAGALRGTERIPASLRDLNRAWLTRALQPRFPGVRVREVELLDRQAGTTDRARLCVTYESAGASPPPPTLFVKLAPRDARTRLFVNLMQLGATEVRFYREIAAAVPVAIPRALHAVAGRGAQPFVLVLDDLAAAGARFATVTSRIGLDDAQGVMRALARLHAAFWQSPRFAGDLAWLRARGRNPNYPVERFISAVALAPGLRRFPEVVPAELRAAAPRISAARDHLEAAWATGPQTLLHGDAHVGNLYFLDTAVGFLDWQVVQCGQGMRDVSYFLINSVPTAVRRAHQRDLIEIYRAALSEHGVSPPSPAVAWEQYRLHAFYAWIGAAVTAAAATLQVAAIARAGLARSCTALLDLDALAALDGL